MKFILQMLLAIFIFTGCTTTKYSVQKFNPQINDSSSYIKNDYIPENKQSDSLKYNGTSNTISIVFPSYTIGKYALEATNSINTYLINKGTDFKLNVYDIVVQNKKNILNVIEQIKKDKVTKVIAMITKEDLVHLNEIDGIDQISFYLPLINKYDIEDIEKLESLNLTFGAISYKDQFKKLIEYSNGKPLVEFYGNSGIGRALHKYLKNENILYQKKIDDNNGRYNVFLENNSKLDNSAVLLNTPIVKSSILLSAINSQELLISSIMSTQLNYTPLLFSLTQKHDREKLIIANSIGNIPSELEEYNKLIGNNLKYSWVNYSTIIGVEYLTKGNIKIFDDLLLKNNQIIFPVKLYRVGNSSFKLIK